MPAGLSNVNIYFSPRSNFGCKVRKKKNIMKPMQARPCLLTWIFTVGFCPFQATGSIVLCECRPRDMIDGPGKTRKSLKKSVSTKVDMSKCFLGVGIDLTMAYG
jgi:hypothetical protein